MIDLYVQSDTLPSANMFHNFWNICIEICELDPARFLTAQELAWQTALKKAEVNLYLLTLSVLEKLQKLIFEIPIILQTLNADN